MAWSLRCAALTVAAIGSLVACSSDGVVNGPNVLGLHAGHKPLPPELLYVLGGSSPKAKPYIEVFDAADPSTTPQPIYTIRPNGGGQLGYLAVDSANTLFVTIYFGKGARLQVYPAGRTQPSHTCTLPSAPLAVYVAVRTLYIATSAYTIEEFPIPIQGAPICKTPSRVLTDHRASLRTTTGLTSVAVDPSGNIFDAWFGPKYNGSIDEFQGGSANIRAYPPVAGKYFQYLASDARGTLVGSVVGEAASIAVIPRGSRQPVFYHPLPEGAYQGVVIATGGTELFTVVDYPSPAVQVYAYDSASAKVGSLLRTYTNVWFYASDLAVYPPK